MGEDMKDIFVWDKKLPVSTTSTVISTFFRINHGEFYYMKFGRKCDSKDRMQVCTQKVKEEAKELAEKLEAPHLADGIGNRDWVRFCQKKYRHNTFAIHQSSNMKLMKKFRIMKTKGSDWQVVEDLTGGRDLFCQADFTIRYTEYRLMTWEDNEQLIEAERKKDPNRIPAHLVLFPNFNKVPKFLLDDVKNQKEALK